MLVPQAYSRSSGVLPTEALNKTKATVIGAGAVGGFAALSLVKMGIGRLEVYDFDDVSIENLGPQWFRPCDLGRPKAEALAEQLTAFSGEGVVKGRNEKFEAQAVQSTVLVCAVDSMDARMDLWLHVRKQYNVCLYIDARMGAEVGILYAGNPQDKAFRTFYEENLYPSTEAARAPCTEKATIYCAAGLGAFIAALVGAHVAGRPVKQNTTIDFRLLMMV